MHKFNLYVTAFFLLMAFGSCEKESLTGTAPAVPTAGSRVGAASCTALDYAETIIYLRKQMKGQVQDYIVAPVTALPGTYGASPEGLVINPLTGAINVTLSETGLRYRLYYVAKVTGDTCSRFITISGIDYQNSVHTLAKNDTLIVPLYNALPFSSMPCAIGNDDGGNNNSLMAGGCEFDDGDDKDSDGGEEPLPGLQIRPKGVAINQLNAIINLKQTVKNGLFGVIPVNGAFLISRVFYRIADGSNRALNHIDVKLVYYTRKKDIPASLMKQVESQNARIAAVPDTKKASPIGYATQESTPRPPVIIVTAQ